MWLDCQHVAEFFRCCVAIPSATVASCEYDPRCPAVVLPLRGCGERRFAVLVGHFDRYRLAGKLGPTVICPNSSYVNRYTSNAPCRRVSDSSLGVSSIIPLRAFDRYFGTSPLTFGVVRTCSVSPVRAGRVCFRSSVLHCGGSQCLLGLFIDIVPAYV